MGLFSKFRRSEGRNLTPDLRFWEWFGENAPRFRAVVAQAGSVGEGPSPQRAALDRLFDELAAQMKRVDRRLTFAFGTEDDQARCEFVVSADGIRDAFPVVRRLVDAAPDIAGWRVTAFRPPAGTGMTIRTDRFELGPGDVWFRAEPQDSRVALTLCIRGLTDETHDALAQVAFILLDNALGEYAIEMCVGAIEFAPLPADPAAAGLLPFEQLPDAVNGRPAAE